MRLPIVLLSSAVLAACQPQPDAPAPKPAQSTEVSSETPSRVSPVTTLEGAWLVAGIDGAEFNEPYGLALSGSAQELWWDPRCAWIVRSYRVEGDKIAFGPALNAPKPGEMPPPVCTIAPPPRIAEVTRALDAATSVARTEQNGILISGGGHSVLLFSQ